MDKILFLIALVILFQLNFKEKSQQPKEVSFIIEKKEDSTYYHVVSNSVAPVEIFTKFKGKKLKGVILKNDCLLKSKDTLYNVIQIDNRKLDSISSKNLLTDFISTKFDYGDSKSAKHNSNYLYSLPVEIGKEVKISQGFYGKKSHSSIHSKYAIDFDIPIGTKIYAAREGIVVYALDHFKKSGGKEFIKKANKIVVLHDDGTFASYSHLKFKGSLVKKGDLIKRGEHIGYSGNTGFSSGPHLHFAVRLPKDICVPVYFEGYEKIELKKGDNIKRLK